MSHKQFKALVFIGRFQPFHLGHAKVVDRALELADEVIIVVGSAFSSRRLYNPFTFEERKGMIKSVYPDKNVKVVPVSDYPYNDNKWVAAVQAVVNSAITYTPDPLKIGLIGHKKDHTSYYLDIFPMWEGVDVPNEHMLNATDIREQIFKGRIIENISGLSDSVKKSLEQIIYASEYGEPTYVGDVLMSEYLQIRKYKDAWALAPFPPTFLTVDAVVVQSGHVLLVKRKASPGAGLWALPGGFLDQTETLAAGARRELKEETGLKLPQKMFDKATNRVFDHPYRSDRGRTVTHAFFLDLGFDSTLPKVKGADDAEKAKWVPFGNVKQEDMFEDHFHIVDYFTNIG